MSKRRNRKNRPNLPEDVLARARREAGMEAEEAAPEPEVEEIEEEDVEEPEEAPEAVAAPPRRRQTASTSQRRNREGMPQVQQRRRRRESKPGEMSQTEVYERLAHPTRDVTEEELHKQYSYVLADLRSMGVLAGLLFVIMIVVARFL